MSVCFICGTPLNSEVDDEIVNGTVFRAGGNYGSGVWDPMVGGGALEIAVCDADMVFLADRVTHVRIIQEMPTTVRTSWTCEEPTDD